MPELTYTLIEWSDHAWSFEQHDPTTGCTIFRSHLDYPLYICESDARHAITLCELARARVHGRAGGVLEVTVVIEKRPRWKRTRDQVRAEVRLTQLLVKARRCYTRYDVMVDRFVGVAG